VLIALAFAALDAPAAQRPKNAAVAMDLRSHPYGGKQPVEVARAYTLPISPSLKKPANNSRWKAS
jgi:hypothetical protein